MKKILICLSVFLGLFIFVPNAFALNILENQKVNLLTQDYEDISIELNRGDEIVLNNYITGNFNNDYFNTYLDKLKLNEATFRGFSSWENLTEQYFYIIQFNLNVRNVNQPSLQINLYLINKNSNNLDSFNIGLGFHSDTNSSLSNSINYYLILGMISNSREYHYDFSSYYYVDINNLSTDSANRSSNSRLFSWSCRNGSSFCGTYYVSTTNTLNVNIYNYLAGGNLFYYSSNYNFDFIFTQFDNYTNYYQHGIYWFNQLMINGSDPILSYNDIISSFVVPNIPVSNITDFGNNSYGINVNSIDNIVGSTDSNFDSFEYICPDDRQFINGVCYIYNTDFSNFDTSYTNFYNQFITTIGASSNSLHLVSNKYYILTYRLYTIYNLRPDLLIFTLTNGVGNVSVNDIYRVVVNDYGFYKDFQIVFDMPSGIDNDIYAFTIKFDNLSTLTSSIEDSYSFGVHKSFKLSQFDSLPTNTIISSDYTNNSIDTISNSNTSSFFSNFSLNDYGLSNIVLLPLNYVRNLSNLTCSSLNLPLPKIGNVQLPCISSFMSSNFGLIWSLYKVIINGLICYKIIINLFSTIKNIYKPDNDSIEVIDL